MSKRLRLFAATAACVVVSACSSAGPARTFVKGDELVFYDFSASDQFEQGTYPDASLLIRDGIYRLDVRTGNDALWWGQWGESYDNVVIDVDANQLSQRNEVAFGIMCRVRGHVGQPVDVSDLTVTAEATLAATAQATTEATAAAAATAQATIEATADANVAAQGLGQMLAGEATAEATAPATSEAIAEATMSAAAVSTAAGELAEEFAALTPEATAESTTSAAGAPPVTTLEENEGDGYLFLIQGTGSFAIMRARGRNLTPLINWTVSDKLKVGPDKNHLRAVCVGNYLAFYANDALLGDTTDDTYSQGQIGLAASAANRLGVRIEFDNLSVSAARPG